MLQHFFLLVIIRFNGLLEVREKVREFTVYRQGTDGVSIATRRVGFDVSGEQDKRREPPQRLSAGTS